MCTNQRHSIIGWLGLGIVYIRMKRENEKRKTFVEPCFHFNFFFFRCCVQMNLFTARTICGEWAYKHFYLMCIRKYSVNAHEISKVASNQANPLQWLCNSAVCAREKESQHRNSFTWNYESVTRSECLNKKEKRVGSFLSFFFFAMHALRAVFVLYGSRDYWRRKWERSHQNNRLCSENNAKSQRTAVYMQRSK